MTTNPASRKSPPPRVMRLRTCLRCGDPFESAAPNARYCCQLCRDEVSIARSGQKNGGGKPVMRAKAEAIAAAVASGIEPQNLPKSLQWSAQLGLPRLKDSPERRARYLDCLAMTGNASDAAEQCDGITGTARFFRALAEKDSAFKADIRGALDRYGSIVHAAVHRLAITGVDEPVVSMGAVIATKKVFSEKLLLALARKHDKELVAANSGGNGTSVTVNIANTGMQADADGSPKAVIYLHETYRLTDSEREQLMNIYGKILAVREQQSEPRKLDWTPPEEVRELIELEATEIEDTASPVNASGESDDDI